MRFKYRILDYIIKIFMSQTNWHFQNTKNIIEPKTFRENKITLPYLLEEN